MVLHNIWFLCCQISFLYFHSIPIFRRFRCDAFDCNLVLGNHKTPVLRSSRVRDRWFILKLYFVLIVQERLIYFGYRREDGTLDLTLSMQKLRVRIFGIQLKWTTRLSHNRSFLWLLSQLNSFGCSINCVPIRIDIILYFLDSLILKLISFRYGFNQLLSCSHSLIRAFNLWDSSLIYPWIGCSLIPLKGPMRVDLNLLLLSLLNLIIYASFLLNGLLLSHWIQS